MRHRGRRDAGQSEGVSGLNAADRSAAAPGWCRPRSSTRQVGKSWPPGKRGRRPRSSADQGRSVLPDVLKSHFPRSGFLWFIAAFRKAALDFQKKYSESLNHGAIRFITLILLFIFQHIRVHRQFCTHRIPRIYFDKFRPIVAAALARFLHLPHPAPPSSPSFPHARRIPDAPSTLFQHVHHRQRLIRRQQLLQLHILFFTQLRRLRSSNQRALLTTFRAGLSFFGAFACSTRTRSTTSRP